MTLIYVDLIPSSLLTLIESIQNETIVGSGKSNTMDPSCNSLIKLPLLCFIKKAQLQKGTLEDILNLKAKNDSL